MCDPQKIRLRLRLKQGLLEITDTGKGADEASLAFMFSACHVSKEQVSGRPKEILCSHKPQDIGEEG